MEDTQNQNVQSSGEIQKPLEEKVVTPEVKVPEILKVAKDQPKTTSEEKIWALLSYVPLMALVSLIMKPESDYVKLHGRQGLLLFIIFFGSIFVYLIPFIGPAIGILIHFAAIIIGVFSMYQAFIGNWWKIPVLGDVSEIIPVEGLTKVARSAMMGEKVDEEKRKEELEAKTAGAGQTVETQQAGEKPDQKN